MTLSSTPSPLPPSTPHPTSPAPPPSIHDPSHLTHPAAPQIPGGSLPRTMDVVVRSNVTDRAKPGDRVVFTGQLVVVPDAASLAGSAAAVSLKPSEWRPGG